MIDRRSLVLGLGMASLIGPRMVWAQGAATAPKDPEPEIPNYLVQPVNPTVIQRWNAADGALQVEGATLDEKHPYRGNPSQRCIFRDDTTLPLVRYTGAPLGQGIYNFRVIAKGEYLTGPVSGYVSPVYRDGTTYTNRFQLADYKFAFNWRQFVTEFTVMSSTNPVQNVAFSLFVKGGGVLWLGAVELVNLGVPSSHDYFQSQGG
jgi:hypothetical protein